MASFAGLRGTGSWGTDERPKNFREMILWRNPNGSAPLTALMGKMKTEKVDDPEFAWWEEEMNPVRVATAADLGTSSTAVTLTAGGVDLVPGDALLRKKLGADYAASVFSPPIRPALHAPSYVEANMQSFEYTEKKLTIQSWNITPKIRVLDDFLTESPELREKLFESHPELLFMNLNRGMIFQKKNTKKGLRHRLDLIKEHEPSVADFFRDIKEEYRRNEVEEDDIVDSMVLALAANHSVEKGIKTIPEEPPVDSKGLKMAIHYV